MAYSSLDDAREKLSLWSLLRRRVSCFVRGHRRDLFSPAPTQAQAEHFLHHFGRLHWQGDRGWCMWCARFTAKKPRFRKDST